MLMLREDHGTLNQMFPGTSLLNQYLKAYKPPSGLDAIHN